MSGTLLPLHRLLRAVLHLSRPLRLHSLLLSLSTTMLLLFWLLLQYRRLLLLQLFPPKLLSINDWWMVLWAVLAFQHGQKHLQGGSRHQGCEKSRQYSKAVQRCTPHAKQVGVHTFPAPAANNSSRRALLCAGVLKVHVRVGLYAQTLMRFKLAGHVGTRSCTTLSSGARQALLT